MGALPLLESKESAPACFSVFVHLIKTKRTKLMDVLSEKGVLTPIMWTGYNEKTKSYQGVITHKGEIQRKFENKILNAKKEGAHDIINWNELDTLLNYIFMAFQNPV